jgi:hypothetical protein
MSCGELFLFLEWEERLYALKDTMETVGVAVKLEADSTVYGEELEEDEPADE